MPAINELLQEGRYRINQHFANGESGGVFEAYDTVSDTNVVIKEIPVRLNKVTTLSQQESIKTAFANEANALKMIQHDSLPRVHDYFSEIGRQYLVLESIDGSNLEDIQKVNGKPFTADELSTWAAQLLDALHYLHSFSPSIIHRSVKPRNIKMTADGKIKLIAYGLAADSAGQHDSTAPDQSSEPADLHFSPLEQIWDGLDRASQKVITNSYDEKSEMLLKQPADARSDIYGLGATLYFLATGSKPTDALERSIDILEGKADPLVSPTAINAEIPQEISNVIMRSLEIRRESRFDSASMMRQALKTSQVLIAEREATEQAEQKDALFELEKFKQNNAERTVAPLQNASTENFGAEDEETSRIKQQLREAEQMRILAEERAAEAERQLRERDLALRPTERLKETLHEPPTFEPDPVASVLTPESVAEQKPNSPRLEPDPVPETETGSMIANPFAVPGSTSEPGAFKPAPEPEELEIPVTGFAGTANDENILPELDLFSETAAVTVVSDDPIVLDDLDPAPSIPASDEPDETQFGSFDTGEPTAFDDDDREPNFGSNYSESARSSSSIGMPMIAGAIAVIAMIAFGGWFLLSGDPAGNADVPPVSSAVTLETEQPQSINDAAATEPASEIVVEDQETDAAIANAPIEVERTSAPQPAETQQTVAVREQTARQTAPARPKKADAPAPKPQAAPKKLTVDDLLNDN